MLHKKLQYGINPVRLPSNPIVPPIAIANESVSSSDSGGDCLMRECRGYVIAAGWIYNEFNYGVTQLEASHDNNKFVVNAHVRYNESKVNNDTFAVDIKQVDKIEKSELKSYYTDCDDTFIGLLAKRYIYGGKLEIKPNLKFVNVAEIDLIVETAEMYLNESSNICGDAILFGVGTDGYIEGRQCITAAKIEYIENEIIGRVPNENYSIEFKSVIDADGYALIDTFVVIIRKEEDIEQDTEDQHKELRKRVQIKLKEMMMIEEYTLDRRWKTILAMASSNLYNGQKTSFILMTNLENRYKSKYKAIATSYCRKMGWEKPTESVEYTKSGYRATVSFGARGEERVLSGDGNQHKTAIYNAYMELVLAEGVEYCLKHPKSIVLQWSIKHGVAPPKALFSSHINPEWNVIMWNAKVTFFTTTVEANGMRKKDAESKCYQQLIKYIIDSYTM